MKLFTKISILLSALAVFCVTTAQAAAIAWSVGSISTTDGDASDVSTQGNLVEAVNFIGSATTINGVTFEAFADTGNDHTTDNLTTEADSAYSNADVYNAGNTSYDTLLDGFMHDSSTGEVDYTLTGLTSGLVYEVQLFIADDRSGPDDRYLSVDSSGNTLGGNSTVYGGAANPGLVFTGTFTADAMTQAFTAQVFSPTNASVGTQLSAFQLRVVPSLDSTLPVITLLGDHPMNVVQGASFTDPGATASDNVDGDISGAITVTGDTVDTNTIGAYILSYDVSDAASNAATTVTRTVNVTATPAATLKAGLDGANFGAASSWGEGIAPSSSNDGTITVDAVHLSRAITNFGGGWTIDHTAGDLQFDGGWNVYGDAGSAATTSYNLSGGSIALTEGGGSDEGNFLANAITFSLSGDGAISAAKAFGLGNGGAMNFLAGAGTLTAASFGATAGTMNFVSGWTGSVTIATLDAASWKTLLATTLAGSTFDGVDITTANFDDYFVVDGSTLSANTTPIVPITWDDGAGDAYWSSGDNWDGGVAPVDGDSVVLITTSQNVLDYAWTIGSGKSLTSTATGYGDELRIATGGRLTLASGGTMDIAFMRPSAVPGGDFIIESGANLTTEAYGLGNQTHNISYIADAAGVTTWFNSGGLNTLQPGLDNLTIDLTNYEIANGTTLVLVDYETTAWNSSTFSSVTLTEDWAGTIDYAFDQGGGDLAIALINIAYQPEVLTSNGTPENWLDFYSLVTGGDTEAADLLDSDSDGRLNWEEYQDGTDPTGVGVTAPIPFTLVEGAIDGAPDTLSFTPPNRQWHVEASTDGVEWGVIPKVTLEVNADDGTVTASVPRLKGLGDDINAGMYRVVETQINSKLTIFLVEGQSNMVGGGGSPWRNEPYLLSDHPLPNMLQLSRGLQRFFYDAGPSFKLIPAFQPLQVTKDQGSGNQTESSFIALDFYFARAYAADHPDEDVLLIKNAKGGTGFVSDDWNDGDWLDANVTPYFEAAFAQNDLTNLYTTIEFGGFLWHQGEADTATEASAAAYEANLTALVARHRSRVAAYITNDAPFILGTMNQHILAPNFDAQYPISAPVNAVHTNIANLVPSADFVDLYDLDAKQNVHFAHPEYRIIGARYYQKWLEVTTQRANQKTWLDLYGLVTGGDYAAADLLDSDSDGKFNWQEYQQGTNPSGAPTESPVLDLQVGDISADDTLTFTPPNTAWVLKESVDLVQWDEVLDAVFITNADGSVTVSAERDAGSSRQFYKLVETGW